MYNDDIRILYYVSLEIIKSGYLWFKKIIFLFKKNNGDVFILNDKRNCHNK